MDFYVPPIDVTCTDFQLSLLRYICTAFSICFGLVVFAWRRYGERIANHPLLDPSLSKEDVRSLADKLRDSTRNLGRDIQSHHQSIL